ncbi:MAG: hypothetical protein K9G40_00130 [Crocinitomicaceae bacterium]|nr:hypothetical protein [Crocinitomicaceae bacterium]MCF8434179.1 hypothetical protein [Crocinitomicaceae bacterium]
MKGKKFGLICLCIVLFTLSCSKKLNFDELTTENLTGIPLWNYRSSQLNYSISLTENLKLVENDYSDTSGFELFIDTTREFEKGTNILSVVQFYSQETKLEETWKSLKSKRLPIESFKIISEGLTNYLGKPAYYEHSTSFLSNNETESISFLFHGDSSKFYLLSVQTVIDEGYPDNLKKLLYCAKSIKMLP